MRSYLDGFDNMAVDRAAWSMGVAEVLTLQKYNSSETMTSDELDKFRETLIEEVYFDICTIDRNERFSYLKGYFRGLASCNRDEDISSEDASPDDNT
jgi:hypothetical protein